MLSDLEQFRKHWNDFEQILINKIKKNGNQVVTHGWMNLLLKNEAGSWTSSMDGNGRWLSEYTQRNPEKGRQIREILTQDMSFTRSVRKVGYAQEIKSFAPVVGAMAGLGLATFLHASNLVQVISTIAPAIAAYPAGVVFSEANEKRANEKWLEEYLSQLNKYKLSIESILS